MTSRGTRAWRKALAGIGIVLLATSAGPQTAAAQSCASEAVVARGDHARFLWLAKAKARSAWRRKVRLLPSLGVPYADWAMATQTEERCIASERSVYCIFSGLPCRK